MAPFMSLTAARNLPFSPQPTATSRIPRRPGHSPEFAAGAKQCPPASLFHLGPRLGRYALSAPSPRHGHPCMALSRGTSTATAEVVERPVVTPQVASVARRASWVDTYLPELVRPYALLARMDKPIGTWLFAWPMFWSIAMAAAPGKLPDLKTIALFGVGSVLVRGLGCTINDLFDIDFDKQVERCKTRPLAAGILTPFQGVCFLGFQLLLSSAILQQFNSTCRMLGLPHLFLIFTYPLMKRMTYWPQAYLGLAMNFGVLLGWAAIKGSLDFAVLLPLFVGCICWTLVYDTIYAHQDKADDIKAGVKSTALMFGNQTKSWITGFGAVCIGSLALGGYNAGLAWPYYASLIAAAGHIAWQILAVDLSNPKDCGRKFISNQWIGPILFSGILLARFVQ